MTIWERRAHGRGNGAGGGPGWLAVPGDLGAFSRELALAALGGLVYFLIRGGVVDRAEESLARARGVMDLERALGLFWEPAMQGWILHSRLLIDAMNALYFWLHMPLIIALAVWLFWRRRDVYRLTRNAFLGSAAIALVLYAVLPLAPPRFFPELGFVDTMALYSEANYQAQELGVFVNPYAALPSLHFGWALLLAMALCLARPRGRWTGAAVTVAALAIPTGQFFAIVLTGNHFIIDAVAGGAVAGLGLAGALAWRRRQERRRPGRGRGQQETNETGVT